MIVTLGFWKQVIITVFPLTHKEPQTFSQALEGF